MSDTPNRRTRRAAAATAPVKPAITASAERAAIERDPATDPIAPVAPVGDAPIVPAAEVADDAKVLPEPTLVAEPDAPKPIVTASPILAAEPSAIDVVEANARAERVEAGIEPAGDPEGPHGAAAGQPTLAIERGGVQSRAAADVIADIDNLGDRRDVFGLLGSRGGDDTAYRLDRQMIDGVEVMTLDEILRNLELLSQSDPIGMDIIRTRFFGDAEVRDQRIDRSADAATRSTVSVIEVVGPAQGRRRAGRTFGPQAQRFLAGELDADDIAALRADPLLAVAVSEVEADAFGYPIGGLG